MSFSVNSTECCAQCTLAKALDHSATGWTPLFLLAGALVMEVGGVVSHGALVAREYGVPAVAGITDAMTRLRTGQRVRVDGTNGSVTLLDRPGTASPAS